MIRKLCFPSRTPIALIGSASQRGFTITTSILSHHPLPAGETAAGAVAAGRMRYTVAQSPKEAEVEGCHSVRRPLRVTLGHLQKLKATQVPIAMVTAYNYATAKVADAHADITLIGDSLAQVALGYGSTNEIPFEEFLHATRAVMRGNKLSFVVADLPFGSFEVSVEQGVASAIALVREGVNAVKIEGAEEHGALISRLTAIGIPVVGHLGLTPQRINALSGFKVQGKNADDALKIFHQAKAIEASGVAMMVLECIPTKLAQYITERVAVPTIGIGAGKHTSGQVLVLSDILGLLNPSETHKPKFVKRYTPGFELASSTVLDYVEEVKRGQFPESSKHDYKIDDAVWGDFVKRAGGPE